MNAAPSAATRASPPARRRHIAAGGFTLVELLVAVTVGMALALGITVMLIRHESGRRALTAVNDVSLGGAYISYVLDRTVRSAGSGYTQNWRQTYGCQLTAARNGTQILPRGSAFPAPFASLPQTQRLVPVLVYAGAGSGGSDILSVATGASGLGESGLQVLPNSATGTGLRVPATIGLRALDLVLVLQDATACLLQQVAVGFSGGADQQLTFGGTYAGSIVNGVRLDAMGTTATAWAVPLGNAVGNQPAFQFFGVGSNNTLQSYDVLLLGGSDAVVPVADGVVDMRVLYGVDSDGDGKVDTWADPSVAPFDSATLLNGSAASQTNLSHILAVRIGLVMCNSAPEKTAVSPPSLVLFSDLANINLQRTRALSASDQLLRWRTVDFTVPLRNLMLK